MATFSVDASEAGSGNLEIMVNGGRVPCQVENKGKRRFLASFIPEDATNHVVEMKFNQVPLAGELNIQPGVSWSNLLSTCAACESL